MTAFAEYDRYDATGLAALVAGGEVSPEELLAAAEARIVALDPALGAVVHTRFGAARTDLAAGLPDGPFRGVPWLLKDLYVLSAGDPAGNGSRFWADYVADHDSTLVERMRAAGLVTVGRTNTPEMGLSAETCPAANGPTRNPWDPARSAGGSSGGSAAAVAAGMVPAAHATDGGGSIRIPASNCGLVGLKPSRGRNPSGPDVGEGWSGLATAHAVTRTVRDSAALLDVTHGPAPGDPYAAPPPERPFADEVGADPGRLRIALMTAAPTGVPVDPECVRAAEDAARLCADLGHHVAEAAPAVDMAAGLRAMRVIVSANVASLLALRARQTGHEPGPGDIEPVTRLHGEEGLALSAADYARAILATHVLGRRMGAFFEDYDVLLSPTLADPPLPLNTLDMQSGDLDDFGARLMAHIPFTPLYNLSGGPAVSLPLHRTAAGLPVGVMFGTRLGGEATLFRLAARIEAARPWHDTLPVAAPA